MHAQPHKTSRQLPRAWICCRRPHQFPLPHAQEGIVLELGTSRTQSLHLASVMAWSFSQLWTVVATLGGAAAVAICTWAKLARPWAVALLALLLLPNSTGAAGLGRVLRQANFQEKAGCLHATGIRVRYGTVCNVLLSCGKIPSQQITMIPANRRITAFSLLRRCQICPCTKCLPSICELHTCREGILQEGWKLATKASLRQGAPLAQVRLLNEPHRGQDRPDVIQAALNCDLRLRPLVSCHLTPYQSCSRIRQRNGSLHLQKYLSRCYSDHLDPYHDAKREPSKMQLYSVNHWTLSMRRRRLRLPRYVCTWTDFLSDLR